jgi:hypothetical protein
MFAPPDWTPMPPVILHIKAAFISFRVWRRKMDPKNVIYIEHPTQCFLSFFFILKIWRNLTPPPLPPPQSQIYTRKTKISQFISQNMAKLSRTKLGGIFKAKGKGLTRAGEKKRKFLNLQSSFSQATHIKFVF